MLLGFDATTLRKTGVGYYTWRLLERLTEVDGPANPIDEVLLLSNRPVAMSSIPRTHQPQGSQFPLRSVWMQSLLPLLLKASRPDLCHFTAGPRARRTPFVVTFHDMTLQLMAKFHPWRKRALTSSLMPTIARKARLIITPSQSARDDLARLYKLPKSKIRVIPHAADTQFRPRTDASSFETIARRYRLQKPYILYVGTLEPRKNLVRTLTAFSRLAPRFSDYRFYLAGDLGWHAPQLLQAIEKLGLRDRVRRLGYVEEEDLPALYSHAELFVYPSLYEGFGLPVLEAMASGVPVLTSNTSSLTEITAGAALLVDPVDVDGMKEAMEHGLSDAGERERRVAAGLARARSFSWERTARETIAVYEEALERSTVRGVGKGNEDHSTARKARAVVDTISYGTRFDYPMKFSEIRRALMGVPLPRQELAGLLESHPDVRRHVESSPPFYFLKGKGHTVQKRRTNEQLTEELLTRHRRILTLIRKTPFVRMVALSGATAHRNASDGDIDLFLITAKGRTWAVSFFLFLCMKALGLRRTICLNYVLGEDGLALPDRDPFTANQILSLRPLAGRTTYYRFVRANDWGANVFANFWESFRELEPIPEEEPEAGSFLLEGLLSLGGGWLMEKMGRLVLGTHWHRQCARAGSPNSVRLTSNAIKLHFKDHGEELAGQIETMLARERPDSEPASQVEEPAREGNGKVTWQLLCPECGASAFTAGADLHCPVEGRRFEGENGILPLLREKRRRELTPFLQTYRKLRRAEGWGGAEEYYRDLPFKDHSGRHRSIWRLRARSYSLAMQTIESHFPEVKKADECDKRASRILELGAGNGWLSRRMAEKGHFVLATDISLDEEDGLGALDRYGSNGLPWRARVTRARADMEALALEGAQFDLVVANGSIHYAERLSRPVQEAYRLLRPGGLFLILDSPTYEDEAAGLAMVRRQERECQKRYALDLDRTHAGFLVFEEFSTLLERTGFRARWQIPFEGVTRTLRRTYCWMRGLHTPARFPVFIAEKK